MLTKRHVADHIAKRVMSVLQRHGYSKEVVKVFRINQTAYVSTVGVKLDIKGAGITADRRMIFIEIPDADTRGVTMGIDTSNFEFEYDPKTRVLHVKDREITRED